MRLNRTKNTIQGTFWGVINKVVALVFPFIVRTIIIKELGAEYSGINSLFTSLLQVLSLAELGFGSAMVYEMYKPIVENDKKTICALLKYYYKIYTVIGVVIAFCGIVITPLLPKMISGSIPADVNLYVLYYLYLLNTVISYFCFAYRASLLSAYQREADNAKIQMLSNSIMYILQIMVLLTAENYYFYILLLPIFTLIYNFLRYKYVKICYPDIKCDGEISLKQQKNIKKNISALFLHKIGGVTVNTIDNIVISAFLGLVILSNYNNYYYLISAITGIIMIIFNSMTAGLGNGLLISSLEKNKQDFYSIFFINGYIVCVCTVCFFSVFQDFITIWIGKQYLFGNFTKNLFCIYFNIHCIRRTIIMYRDAAGMWEDNKWQPIVSAAINLTLNISLVQFVGVNGILISTIVSMLLIDIPWETITLLKKLFNDNINNYVKWLVLFSIVSIFSCILEQTLVSYIDEQNIFIKMLIEGTLAIVISNIVFFIGTIKYPERKRVIAKLKSIKKKGEKQNVYLSETRK